MRRNARVLLLVATCVIPTACITGGFKQPLGSVEEAFLEPGILGSWACSSVDEATPSVLNIMDFDGKQYYIESSDGKGDPTRLRALGHRIEDVAFLSALEVGKKDDEWVFLAYAQSDADHLSLRAVDATPFEDVLDDAPSVKQRLAEQMQDPEVVVDLLSCTRVRPPG